MNPHPAPCQEDAVKPLTYAPYRTSAYSAVSFAAFRVSGGQTSRINVADSTNLKTTLNGAQLACLHGEKLVIRETDEAGSRLHVYAIRRAAPKWVHPPGEIVPRRVVDLFADPVCVIDGSVLS